MGKKKAMPSKCDLLGERSYSSDMGPASPIPRGGGGKGVSQEGDAVEVFNRSLFRLQGGPDRALQLGTDCSGTKKGNSDHVFVNTRTEGKVITRRSRITVKCFQRHWWANYTGPINSHSANTMLKVPKGIVGISILRWSESGR